MKDVPKLIFKYRSVTNKTDKKRLKDIIKNKHLYFPTVLQLNDPFEGMMSDVKFLKAGASLSAAADVESGVITSMKSTTRILSLSEDCFSPQLWAYYCNDYNGVCLCFKTNNHFSSIEPVSYPNPLIEEENIVEPTNEEVKLLLKERLLNKQEGWKYEHEWRIITDNEESSFFDYDKEELVAVIIGHKLDDLTSDFLKLIIPKTIPLYKTYPGANSGKIQLLEHNYVIQNDGRTPDFIDTNEQLIERINKYKESLVEEYDVNLRRRNALGFFNAACSIENTANDKEWLTDVIAPFTVNIMLSCELFLKSLLFPYKYEVMEKLKNHRVDKLYNLLKEYAPATSETIEKLFYEKTGIQHSNEDNLMKILKANSDNFVSFRYLHENRAKKREVHLTAIPAFVRAMMEVIKEQETNK